MKPAESPELLSVAAQAMGARFEQAVIASFKGVCLDSRDVQPGQVFVAVNGQHCDGHDHIGSAFEHGAVAALVEESQYESVYQRFGAKPFLVVADVCAALQRWAAWWRQQFCIPVIAVVGSNGKTSVKEMIAHLLRGHFQRVHATLSNKNNHWGVSLTLLALSMGDQVAVVEMGTNHLGEIATLAAMVRPTMVLINNAQREHLLFLGNVAQVAAENASAIHYLAEDGVVFLNRDDAFFESWQQQSGSRSVVSFGSHPESTVRLVSSRVSIDFEAPALGVQWAGGAVQATLQVLGWHNLLNATAAISCAVQLGVSSACIEQRLSSFSAVSKRLMPRKGIFESRILDDTYNANPDSVLTGLQVLSASSNAILVLGDMVEMGPDRDLFYREIGLKARELGLKAVFSLGDSVEMVSTAFGAEGFHFQSLDALVVALKQRLSASSVILVKGSRASKMERVVAALSA